MRLWDIRKCQMGEWKSTIVSILRTNEIFTIMLTVAVKILYNMGKSNWA